MFESVCIPRQRYLFVTGLLAQLRLRHPGRVRRNRSGAAQAARCLAYTVQFHLNVEPISPHDVVVLGLRADWGELAPPSPGCSRSSACVTGPLAAAIEAVRRKPNTVDIDINHVLC
jgi:hypothetical protein